MLSISKPKTAGAAANYFATHLAEGKGGGVQQSPQTSQIEDYYAAEGDPGRWYGSGLQRVGLAPGEVTARDFQRLATGRARDGQSLAQNAGDPDRRAGWDLTFSAPKSVSVVWALAERERRAELERAQAVAVDRALALLEQKSLYVRTGRDGAHAQHAKMVAALFAHGTSREQDPQLHTHAFVINLGVREDDKTSSLDPREMMRWQKAIGAAYRAELANQLREMGYQVERDGDAFRIVGVSREAEREFSQRRQQIEARLRELGLRDAKSSENVALETRRGKELVPQAELEAQWAARAAALGLTREAAAELRGAEPGRALELASAAGLLEKLTQHDAVIEERRIYQAAAEAAQGAGGLRDARLLAETAKLVAVELTDAATGKTFYTTRAMIQAERSVIEIARSRGSETQHQLDQAVVDRAIARMESERSSPEQAFRLRPEQRRAVLALSSAKGATAALVGDAGTGKSTALEAVRRAYEAQGYQVIGAALAGKAAAGLEADAGIQSRTIDRLMFNLEQGRSTLDRRTVLVVDEAGMIDSRKMAQLSALARDAGAKLILVGDHKQLQPVGAGATFRHLAAALARDAGAKLMLVGDHKQLQPVGAGATFHHLAAEQPAARLAEIGRQSDDWAREAVREMSRGEAAAALGRFVERGLVDVEKTHAAAVRRAADWYVRDHAELGADKVQAIAATNSHVRDLNQSIRERLKGEGVIRDACEIQVRDGRDPDSLTKLELAVGERVVVVRNENRIGLKNGDFATVMSVSSTRVVLRVDRLTKEIVVDPRQVCMRHGYAATTHKMQGATVERAIVLGSEHTSREMSYVQASRAKGETRWIFTAEKVRKLEDGLGVTPAAEQSLLERLRGVTAAMSQSRQKVSTLDHQVRSVQPPTLDQQRDISAALPPATLERDGLGL